MKSICMYVPFFLYLLFCMLDLFVYVTQLHDYQSLSVMKYCGIFGSSAEKEATIWRRAK